jgi:hypothetical protein
VAALKKDLPPLEASIYAGFEGLVAGGRLKMKHTRARTRARAHAKKFRSVVATCHHLPQSQ